MKIDIIGAGIGGLTTAIALEQKGIQTSIFEQADEIKKVGAGIILANNAMQVYDKLGLRETIEKHGHPISSMNITQPNLKPISKVDLTYFEQKHNTKNIAIHRGTLQQILIDKLKSTEINLNHKITSIEKTINAYDLHFENGKKIQSSVIIGADGLNSTVRQNLFQNQKIRNAYQICWRAVIEYKLPAQFKNELNEAWGKKARFGFVEIGSNKVYWYALKSFKEKNNAFSVNDLPQYFSGFHPIITDLIQSTPKGQINIAEISDLKPPHAWFKDDICLIGDAAHATTPNMGQGACQAIEDAYTLSECLNKFDVQQAFMKYQTLRLPKAHQVVKTSWTIGKIAHLSNPLLIGLRNQVLRLTPSSVARKQNEKIFQLAKI